MNKVLIGMPASGKSTIGVVLAKTLQMNFVDTDILIQREQGMGLQDIIRAKGVDGFNAIENEILSNLQVENSVISTGGSAVYHENGMQNLKVNGEVIYLDVPLEILKLRLNNIKTRGIIMRPDESIESLYKARRDLYCKYADIKIECGDRGVEDIIFEIVK